MAFKDKLNERMQVLGYSQCRLAKMSGISQGTISNLLCGRSEAK